MTYVIISISFFLFGLLSAYIMTKTSGWSKWETVEENKRMEMVQTNPITGYVSRGTVFVDVLMKKHKTGKVKFKSIPRS